MPNLVHRSLPDAPYLDFEMWASSEGRRHFYPSTIHIIVPG
jgi:hypothetical protein